MIAIKRVYDETPAKGRKFLVERLWPRGLKKEALNHVVWLKDVAPSTGLRKWFSHDPARYGEFQRRYFGELDANPDACRPLLEAALEGSVTLLYSARDSEHNSAVALRRYLETRIGEKAKTAR